MDLNQKIRTLPTDPGVYLYKDAEDRVIYVGKAKNLRARVRSYFLDGAAEDAKTGSLLREAVDIEYIVVANEGEALALSNMTVEALQNRWSLAESLAKIRVRFRNLPFGRRIEEPGHPDGGVANEPVGFIAGAAPLSLEQIVDQSSRVSEVPAKISDSGPDRFHDDKPINPAGRLDDAGHQPLVEAPHHPIERFDGVGNGFGENNGLRLRLTSAFIGFRRDKSARQVRCRLSGDANGWLLPVGEQREAQRQDHQAHQRRTSNSPARLGFQVAHLPGLEAKIILGLAVQRKLRVLSLPATWSRACGIDAATLRGHLGMTMPNLNCFGHRFPPIDFDSGSIWVRRRRLCGRLRAAEDL